MRIKIKSSSTSIFLKQNLIVKTDESAHIQNIESEQKKS